MAEVFAISKIISFILKTYFVRLLVAATLLALLIVVLIINPSPDRYVTTDISDYGNFVGNCDNDYAKEYISDFLPGKIESYFMDVEYSYRAIEDGNYSYEAYLEFRIDDPETFRAFIGADIMENSTVFSYDPQFKEYVLSERIGLSDITISEESDAYYIQSAQITKILYAEETGQIIYVVLGVRDGWFATTDFLCKYFDRFDIDPKEYELALEEKKPEF